MNCPHCHQKIPNKEISFRKDSFHCSNCHKEITLTDLRDYYYSNKKSEYQGFNINDPPKGCRVSKKAGKMIIEATTRSPIAFFLVPFMTVWTYFTVISMYGGQILSGRFDLILSITGIPFLLGAIVFWGLTLLLIFGKVSLSMDKSGGRIFTGIGIIGKTKIFNWEDVIAVEEKIIRGNKNNTPVIILRGQLKNITFASMLTAKRRYYIMRTLKLINEKLDEGKYL